RPFVGRNPPVFVSNRGVPDHVCPTVGWHGYQEVVVDRVSFEGVHFVRNGVDRFRVEKRHQADAPLLKNGSYRIGQGLCRVYPGVRGHEAYLDLVTQAPLAVELVDHESRLVRRGRTLVWDSRYGYNDLPSLELLKRLPGSHRILRSRVEVERRLLESGQAPGVGERARRHYQVVVAERLPARQGHRPLV